MKRCPDCGRWLPTEAFRKNRARPDGLSHYCRECFSTRDAASYRRRRAASGKPVREAREVPAGSKWCPACRRALLLDDFQRHATQSGGYASYCKACKAGRDEDRRLMRAYGLDRHAVDDLRRSQGGRCLLCRTGAAQHVDHDHLSGLVRGLLCFPCNAGLGQFGDRPDLLQRAAAYVHERGWHRVPEVAGVVRLVPPRRPVPTTDPTTPSSTSPAAGALASTPVQRSAPPVPDLAPLLLAGRSRAVASGRRTRPSTVARRLRGR